MNGGARVLVTGAAGLLGARLVRSLDALAAIHGPEGRRRIQFKPDERIEALFGRYPDLQTRRKEALGFRRDASAIELMKKALSP